MKFQETIGDAAAHNARDLVKISLGMETVARFQLFLDFRAQRHQLQYVDHYGDSANAFMASSASLKRLVRCARFSALA